MPDKRKMPEPEILNPRYEGATPEMVALALLRSKPNEPRRGGETLVDGVDRVS